MAGARERTSTRGFRFISPLRDFLRTEAAGGLVLVVATIAALVWANSPVQDSYRDLWSTVFTIGFPTTTSRSTLHGWVNDGLMAIFFFVVGLEIKRELVEASSASRARRRSPRSPRSAAWSFPPRSTSRSTRAARASTGGASPWRPTSRSRSAC